MTVDRLRLVAVTPDRRDLTGDALTQRCRETIEGGASAVMFREKRLDDEDFRRLASDVARAVHDAGGHMILNERYHLAAAVEADMVHLTYRSPPTSEVRRTLHDGCCVGRSVHTLDEAVAADADYVVFGPILATPSKTGLLAPRGFDALAACCSSRSSPVVAIGGMDVNSAFLARSAGADGIAAMRAIFSSSNAKDAAAALLAAWRGRGRES